MAGGLGSDTYVIDSMNDVVTEDSGTTNGVDLVQASVSYTISDADVENLSLTGSAAVNATGNGSANTLIGNSANNVLNGGGGVDTANYSGATVGVSVNLATGTASSTATGTDTLVAIENVTTGTGADHQIGDWQSQRQQQFCIHGVLSGSPWLFSGLNSLSSARLRLSSHSTTNCG